MSTSTGRTQRGAGPAPTRQQLDELDALLQKMLALPVAPGGDDEPAPAPPRLSPTPRPAAARSAAPARPAEEPAPSVRSYPPSYMVVETPATPAYDTPPLPAGIEPPVPGGRHDLVEDVPADPVQELARRRLEEQPAEWVPFQSSWQPSAQTWGPLAESWRQAQPGPAPTPAAGPPIPPLPPMPRRPAQPSGPTVQTETVEVQEYPAETPPRAEQAAPIAPAPTPAPAPAPPKPGTPVILWPLVAFNAVFDVFLLPLWPLRGWLRRPSGGGVLAAAGVLCLLAAALLLLADWNGWSF